MQEFTTLENPDEVVRYLTNALGKSKVRQIRFGYRLENEEPAIKFKIWLRFPYNLFARKKVEEKVEEEMSHIRISSDPAKILFQVE
ncbi:hypothetical protein [Chitinophaga agri]|uniref:Uncharacterized protein n=1 Tax=Chitinophaga agri TaxID=2703787 RepID=A0A6B9ZC41_9BACT|nr:hypothetical protein [Chitinophaga agri]QHS59319.1 hypothetical protein GWR21_06895 [Chitinophaga agri]